MSFTSDPNVWEIIEAAGTALAAIFAGVAAYQARKAAEGSETQASNAYQLQRELAVDAQWMRYQDFYKETIGLYSMSPGMAYTEYQKLDGTEKRKLHLAAIAMLQTLDLAYRADDEFRAQNLKRYLAWHEGPLATVGAIDAGALKDTRTFVDWNEIRRKHGAEPLPPEVTTH